MTEFMDRQIRLQRAGKKEYSEEEVRLIINGAIAEEREACAVIAFNAKTYLEAAAAIRARGQGWVKTYSGGKPNYTQPIEQEPFEYWNAVEGWVKIDEVRQHFDTAGCGTIYKTAGEDRVPLYTAPPKREWVALTDEVYEAMAEQYVTNCYFDTLKYARAIEAKLKDNNYDND